MNREAGEVWEAVREGIRNTVVEHSHYVETRKKILRTLKTDRLVLFVGAAGVGKTTLVRRLVRELNEAVEEESWSLRAICIRAPSAHGSKYGWKDFYRRWSGTMGEPLPDRKVSRKRIVSGSAADRSRGSFLQGTVDVMRSSMFKATIDRGIKVVFVDEAANLVLNEQGRTLRDRLDILRDMSDESSEEEKILDEGSFSIVLFSTFRIVEEGTLELSGELIWRMGRAMFPRYDPEAAVGSEDFLAYRDIVKSFLDAVPEELRPTLGVENLEELLRWSVGCVGFLCRWFLRAIALCEEEGAKRLEWRHFKKTRFSKGDVDRLNEQCRKGEEAWNKLEDGDEDADRTPSGRSASRSAASGDAGTSSSCGRRKKSGGRIGLPSPSRPPVGLDGE